MHPRTIIPLSKANLEEPAFCEPDPVAIISNISRLPRRWKRKRAIKSFQELRCSRIKFAPLHESEKQQLQHFCNACKGIPQVMNPYFPFNNQAPSAPAVPPPAFKDEELAMAINATLQSASHESPAKIINSFTDGKSYAREASASHTAYTSKCEVPMENSTPISIPTAPVSNAAATNYGPIQYPSIDMSSIDASSPTVAVISTSRQDTAEHASSSFTICLDAPVEGACVPCEHMEGCMMCLSEIEAKKWGCPVCRTKINKMIRIYAV